MPKMDLSTEEKVCCLAICRQTQVRRCVYTHPCVHTETNTPQAEASLFTPVWHTHKPTHHKLKRLCVHLCGTHRPTYHRLKLLCSHLCGIHRDGHTTGGTVSVHTCVVLTQTDTPQAEVYLFTTVWYSHRPTHHRLKCVCSHLCGIHTDQHSTD